MSEGKQTKTMARNAIFCRQDLSGHKDIPTLPSAFGITSPSWGPILLGEEPCQEGVHRSLGWHRHKCTSLGLNINMLFDTYFGKRKHLLLPEERSAPIFLRAILTKISLDPLIYLLLDPKIHIYTPICILNDRLTSC